MLRQWGRMVTKKADLCTTFAVGTPQHDQKGPICNSARQNKIAAQHRQPAPWLLFHSGAQRGLCNVEGHQIAHKFRAL